MNTRFLALALAGTLTLGLLTACGGGDVTPPQSSAPVTEESVSPAPESSAPVAEESPEALPETTPPTQEESQSPAATPSAPAASAKPSTAPETKPSTAPVPTPTPSQSAADPVQSAWDDISKLELPSLIDVDDATLTALYGIDPADLDHYICKMPMMSVQATEFFIAQVKDGKMDTVKAAVAKRQADLETQWAQYLPEQLELVKNYQLVTSGNYILFAVSEHAADAVSAFNSYTN